MDAGVFLITALGVVAVLSPAVEAAARRAVCVALLVVGALRMWRGRLSWQAYTSLALTGAAGLTTAIATSTS